MPSAFAKRTLLVSGRGHRAMFVLVFALVAFAGCKKQGGATSDAGLVPGPPTERPDHPRLSPAAAVDPDGGAALLPTSALTDGGVADGGTDAPLTLKERGAVPGRLAFVREKDEVRTAWIVSPDGKGEQPLQKIGDSSFPGHASPDGRWLVGVSVEGPEGSHIEQLVLWDLATRKGRKLGKPSRRTRNPVFSPDGKWIVFESAVDGFSDLYRISPDGKKVERLTSNPEGNFDPAFSPDGKQLAFVSSRTGDAELYRMRSDGEEEERLTAFHLEDLRPLWSPSGKHIAFLSNREGSDAVFVMNPDGTGQRPLAPVPRAARRTPPPEDREHGWAPDGSRLVWVRREGPKRSAVYAAAPEGGPAQRLTSAEAVDDMPRFSPDGRHLVFVSDRSGSAQLYLMRSDGTGVTRLTKSDAADWLPVWIPPRPRR